MVNVKILPCGPDRKADKTMVLFDRLFEGGDVNEALDKLSRALEVEPDFQRWSELHVTHQNPTEGESQRGKMCPKNSNQIHVKGFIHRF